MEEHEDGIIEYFREPSDNSKNEFCMDIIGKRTKPQSFRKSVNTNEHISFGWLKFAQKL